MLALWRRRAKLHFISQKVAHVKVTSVEVGCVSWEGGDETKVMKENQSDSQTAQWREAEG